ncbi:MAG: hypothetical protein GX556_08005 [Fibrobacter sp.]|nr:hypothetical protein [Fibrobacter sp.]
MSIKTVVASLLLIFALSAQAQNSSAPADTGKPLSNIGYTSIFYHDSTYILTCSHELLYSTNGLTWKKAASPKRYFDIKSFTYFKNRFIGAGFDGGSKMALYSSSDGKSWQAHILKEKARKGFGGKSGIGLWGIASNDSIAVTCGARGTVLFSHDGETWTKVKLEQKDISPFFSVCWTGKRFIAVGAYGRIIISEDGKIWKTANSVSDKHLYDVTGSETGCVASGTDGTLLYSKAGVNWTDAKINAEKTDHDKITTVINVNGRFIAAGYKAVVGPVHLLNNLQFGRLCVPATYIVGTGPEAVYFTSDDGKKWSKIDGTPDKLNKGIQDLIWDGTQFIATANAFSPSLIVRSMYDKKSLITSIDGNTWNLKE